jgi:hypothetical protein
VADWGRSGFLPLFFALVCFWQPDFLFGFFGVKKWGMMDSLRIRVRRHDMGLASRITVLPLRELENYEVEFLFSYRYLALGPVDLLVQPVAKRRRGKCNVATPVVTVLHCLYRKSCKVVGGFAPLTTP